MAPPKRKTGGRVTPTGTRPNDTPRPASAKAPTTKRGEDDEDHRYQSGRYTPAQSKAQAPSPSWVPALMLGLFVLGAAAIITRYLWWDSNVPMIIGMVALLGGLFTATRWR